MNAISLDASTRSTLSSTSSLHDALPIYPARLDGGRPVSVRRPVLSLPLREPMAPAAPEAAPTGVVPVAGLERDGRVGGQAPVSVPDGLHADHAHRPALRRLPPGHRAPRV